jgi:hypothetical protein
MRHAQFSQLCPIHYCISRLRNSGMLDNKFYVDCRETQPLSKMHDVVSPSRTDRSGRTQHDMEPQLLLLLSRCRQIPHLLHSRGRSPPNQAPAHLFLLFPHGHF